MKNEKIRGVLISYFTVAFQMITNFVFTPLLIKAIGLEEYGLYETINSLGNTLLIMNFGVSAIVSRSIVKYRNAEDKHKLENFLAMSAIISFSIVVLVIIIGGVLSNYINVLYGKSFTAEQLQKAKIMFIYIIINLGVMCWRNYTAGIISGYEKFSFASMTKLLKQVLRIVILSVLLMIHIDALLIVITDLVITVLLVIAEMFYCFVSIKVPVKYHHVDKKVLKEVFLFSIASIIQTITNQINLSLDKVILGVMMTPNDVAIYAVGMLIVNVMVAILQIISGVYMPEATRLVLEKAGGEKLTDLIIKPGRVQSFIGCTAVFGFMLVGKEFLTVWVGESFTKVWLSTVILLIFTMLTYTTSVANVILDAMLKKMVRSLILICTAIFNVIITVILVRPIGYFGAAIGTASSMFIGNIVLLNLYYKKKIKINIFRMYKEIFSGIVPCAIVSFGLSMLVKQIVQNLYAKLVISGGLFFVCYVVLLLLFGLKTNEKILIRMYLLNIKKMFKRT